jgi:RNA recognition motif-containing protein
LYVGNLSYTATQGEVESLFSEVGPVAEVFLPTDRETGRPRGFAFVRYESEEHAAEAITKFNNFDFKGRPLRVSQAEERAPRGPRGPRMSMPSSGFEDEDGERGHFAGGGGGGGGGRPKGSRRNLRARKRSL